MPNIVVILADGFEEIEAVTVIDIFRRANIQVTVAGLKNGPVIGSRDISINTDALLNTLHCDDFDMIVLPGGVTGAENINSDLVADRWIRQFKSDNKLIGAICAAPFVLAEKGIFAGSMATSYPSFKTQVETDSEYMEHMVVVDEQLITSRGPATAAEFAFTIVELLVDEQTANTLRKAMLFAD